MSEGKLVGNYTIDVRKYVVVFWFEDFEEATWFKLPDCFKKNFNLNAGVKEKIDIESKWYRVAQLKRSKENKYIASLHSEEDNKNVNKNGNN